MYFVRIAVTKYRNLHLDAIVRMMSKMQYEVWLDSQTPLIAIWLSTYEITKDGRKTKSFVLPDGTWAEFGELEKHNVPLRLNEFTRAQFIAFHCGGAVEEVKV